MNFDGIEWDKGNWPKCAKHGLRKADIEFALSQPFRVFDDPFDRSSETRFRAIGRTVKGRHVFIVFCMRIYDDEIMLRPISARYMHDEEVKDYVR